MRRSSCWSGDRQMRKRLYELIQNRSKMQLRNAPKPLENSDTEHHPEDRQNAFLGEMNQLQIVQEDLWSKGTVQLRQA
jgi:hypothetical protein